MIDRTSEWVKRCPPSCVDRACTTPAVIAEVSMATFAMRDTIGQVLWCPSARVVEGCAGVIVVASALFVSRGKAAIDTSGAL
eukprot:4444743-Pleurochrysis_carterae.AAC.1